MQHLRARGLWSVSAASSSAYNFDNINFIMGGFPLQSQECAISCLLSAICVTLLQCLLSNTVRFCLNSCKPHILRLRTNTVSTRLEELIGGCIMKGVGRKIQKYRELAGFTQEQLAEKAQISPTYLSAIERGIKTPALDVLVRIINLLGAEPNDILEDVVPLNAKKRYSAQQERLKELPVQKQKKAMNIFDVVIEELRD